MIGPGLGKDADTAPKGLARPTGGGGGARPGAVGGMGGMGQQQRAPVQQQQQQAAFQPPQPVVQVRAAPVAASVPRAKALYDYPGQTADELTFREGDIITIIKKDPGGWWEGELNGQRGWIPANYVEELA